MNIALGFQRDKMNEAPSKNPMHSPNIVHHLISFGVLSLESSEVLKLHEASRDQSTRDQASAQRVGFARVGVCTTRRDKTTRPDAEHSEMTDRKVRSTCHVP